MDDQTRRRELADFLRKRRERIDPADVGLHKGARRRTPGLRREEVAILAGLSPTWYTYLEQARNVSPSPRTLAGLADILGLSDHERIYLTRLARPVAPGLPEAREGGADDELRRRLTRSLDPVPAFVTSRFGDVLSWNDAVVDWYTDFGRLPDGRRNLLLWMFTADEARERFVDWATEARTQVAHLRAAAVDRYGDPRLELLVKELGESSPHFRKWWNEHCVRTPGPRVRSMRHARHGITSTRILELHEEAPKAGRVVLHIPVT